MNFIDLQPVVRSLIASHPTFEDLADDTVFEDVGASKSDMEAALDVTNGGAGYAIAIWPPAHGSSDAELSGVTGVESKIVVRFEISPKLLTNLKAANPSIDPAIWLNTRIKDIIAAVLSQIEEAGGVRFRLAQDAFELVNFDDGLIAYHIRFVRLAVFDFEDEIQPPLPTIPPPRSFRMTDSVTGAIVTLTIQDGQIQLDA